MKITDNTAANSVPTVCIITANTASK